MGTTSNNEGYLNVNQIALHLNSKVSWIYQNHKRLGIPCYSLGRKLLFKRHEVDAWLANKK